MPQAARAKPNSMWRSLRRCLEDNGFRVLRSGSLYPLSPFLSPLAPRLAERLFVWETRRGRDWGPILFTVAEPERGERGDVG